MSTAYLKATFERAIKTAAQTAIALIGTNAMGVTDIDWQGLASGVALATLLSVLTSVASSGWGSTGPSLAGEKLDESAAGNGDHERGAVSVEFAVVAVLLVLILLAVMGYIHR